MTMHAVRFATLIASSLPPRLSWPARRRPPSRDPPGCTDSCAAGAGGGSSNISVGGNLGPPIDLWDTNWPESGYYWTVIPVIPIGLGLSGTFVAPPGAAKGATSIPVTTTTGTGGLRGGPSPAESKASRRSRRAPRRS